MVIGREAGEGWYSHFGYAFYQNYFRQMKLQSFVPVLDHVHIYKLKKMANESTLIMNLCQQKVY